MDTRIVWFVAVGLMLGAVTGMTEQSGKEKVAIADAEKWLGIVDEGKYGESWKEAAEYFRNAVKQDQWEQAMQSAATGPASAQQSDWREEFAYTLGVQAFIYGFPWIYLPKIRWEYVTQPTDTNYVPYAALNHFWHARYLIDATYRDGGSPQSDTLYSVCWANLTNEPLILSVPAIAGRYYSFELASMDSDNFDFIGTRTTGTNAGNYAIIGPNWVGTLPTGVTEVAHSRTPYAFVLGRTLVLGTDDVANVHAIQDQYKLTPLSCWSTTNTLPDDRDVWAPFPTNNDPLAVWKTMNRSMTENPPNVSNQQSFVNYISQIGLGPNQNVTNTDAATQRGLIRAAQDGMALMEAFNATGGNSKKVNGWSYPPMTMGRAGQSDDFLTRAAAQCWVGIVAVDTAEGVYLNTTTDEEGLPLTGANDYIIRFPSNGLPDVNAFWSVTMYGMDHNFVSNQLNRYKLGTYPVGLMQTDLDGSLPIYVQHASPGLAKESNWLPAPIGVFYLIMRNYLPGSNILNQTWGPPPVVTIMYASVYTDYDGDGKSDPVAYQDEHVTVALSGSGYELFGAVMGGSGGIECSADFDGDGKADPAVYNPITSLLSVLLSARSYALVGINIGGAGYVPVVGDFDGDRKADPAVYSATTGQIVALLSGSGYSEAGYPLGGAGWLNASADYDGDGQTDPAAFETASGRWQVLLSSDGYSPHGWVTTGGAGFVPVAGDYDGDGKADLMTYQPAGGLWLCTFSGQNYTTTGGMAEFGGPTMVARAGDSDGDGKADPAVYDPITRTFYVMLSGSSYRLAGLRL